MIGLGMDSLPTNIADFFPKDYQDTIENVHLPAIYKKNKWKGEAYFKNFKTGDLIPIEMSGFLIKDSLSKNPIALGIVATNISIRKKAEKKLREKEKSLVIAQKIARIGSFNLDLETKKIKGSSALMNILGIDKNSEFNTDIWKTLIHTEDVSANLKEIQKCIETGEKFDMEFRVLTKNKNKLKWIHGLGELTFIDGKAVNFFGTAQDITDRKIAENKIAKANEQLTQANKELNILRNQLEQENVYLRNELDLVFNYEEMIYGSEAFSQVLSEVEKVAPTNATVLLLGESGTGKELLARAVHNTSTRKKKSLIKVNCSAIPRELIESELFGHKKGSFTGAINDKIGKFELADGGTLFLDEIGDLPLDMQPKILRFLQEGEIEVVGGLGLKKLDVRVIAATNRNLKEAIEEKQFREDLFFRLNVFPIEIPPLRKRREDIPLLVEHFVDKFNKAYEKNIRYIPDDAMNQLKNYNWPGNVRELENLIERAVIISNDNTLTVPGFETSAQESKKHINKRDTTLAAIQRKHILQVLENCEWKISGLNSASVLLDIKPSTLRDKMTKLGIKKPNKQ